MFLNLVNMPGCKLKRLTSGVFIIVILLYFQVISCAGEAPTLVEELIEPHLNSNEIRDLQRNLEGSMTNEARELIPYYSANQLMEELVHGNLKDDMGGLPQRVINLLIGEIKVNFSLVLKLIIIIFLSSFIKNLQGSFKESTVGELAYFSCYAAVVTMLALGFQNVLEYAREVLGIVDKITSFAIPSMIALLISSGNFVSGSTLQPILLFAVQATVKIFNNVFLPLCFMAGILYIISGLSEKIKVSGMASFLKQIVTWGLGGILTLYASAVALRGFAGAVIDGATTKTAKAAMSTFIPVAGKYMADAADTIISCALVIKNTAGMATMIITLAACMTPILKIFAISMMYRLTAAVIEPIADERFFDCLSSVSDCMKTILGVVGAAVFMLLLSIAALLGAGGVSGMMQ
ncbi:MAG: stage III sporulation protein AE [Ruminiclostridium sp.]|nr:stage III sporulation protein AE [Ruminiclostridium sp.]